MHGEEYARWTDAKELEAGILFALQVGNYQRAGKKHGKKPKPIQRPRSKTERRFAGNTRLPLDELDALIGWESPRTRK